MFFPQLHDVSRNDVPSPSSGASSSLQLAPEPSISSSSAGYVALASSFCEAFPLRRAFRSFSWVETRTRFTCNPRDTVKVQTSALCEAGMASLPISFYAAAESHPVSASSCN